MSGFGFAVVIVHTEGENRPVPADHSVQARSPDGSWWFEAGQLRSATLSGPPFTIDFFERWTFARFLSNDLIALGFESGQPWAEYGSYGDPYGGVEVLRFVPKRSVRSLVSMEYDQLALCHNQEFVPDDVVWHPRGVLGWLVEGVLTVQVLTRPREPAEDPNPWPEPDSTLGLAATLEKPGGWQRLSLDDAGDVCTAVGPAGTDRFDLTSGRHSTDGVHWQSLEVWESGRCQ